MAEYEGIEAGGCAPAVHVQGVGIDAARQVAIDCVPYTWLDPLLTGDKAVLRTDGNFQCPEIEALLNAIRKRIGDAFDAMAPAVCERSASGSTDWWAELRKVQEELKARGVKDVKFAWAPDVHTRPKDEVARDVVLFLRALLDGKYRVIPDTECLDCGEPKDQCAEDCPRVRSGGARAVPAHNHSGETPRTDAIYRRWQCDPKAPNPGAYTVGMCADLGDLARDLEKQIPAERFRPMGDNHHNAEACPYCNPKGWKLSPPVEDHAPAAWLIFYDDTEVKPEMYAGAGAEAGARKRFADISANWNAHLFALVESNSRDARKWITPDLATLDGIARRSQGQMPRPTCDRCTYDIALCTCPNGPASEPSARELLHEVEIWKQAAQVRAAAEDRLCTARAEVARLEALVYVPGLWRCAKCKLDLTSAVLAVQTGTMHANTKPQDCPNGCGPMWRVTERDERKDAQKSFNDLFEKHRAALGGGVDR